MSTSGWLPDLLREAAERFGADRAARLAETFGGRYIYLPTSARADHPVAVAAGIDVLAWLIEREPRGARVVVPLGPRRAQQRAARAARDAALHLPAPALAAEAGVHVRTVYRWRARARARAEGERCGRSQR
jgi:hypothetical protein